MKHGWERNRRQFKARNGESSLVACGWCRSMTVLGGGCPVDTFEFWPSSGKKKQKRTCVYLTRSKVIMRTGNGPTEIRLVGKQIEYLRHQKGNDIVGAEQKQGLLQPSKGEKGNWRDG